MTGCGEWAATQPCARAAGAADKSNVITAAGKAAAIFLELFMSTDLLGWLMLASGVSICPAGCTPAGKDKWGAQQILPNLSVSRH
jgi:hypothetical protein